MIVSAVQELLMQFTKKKKNYNIHCILIFNYQLCVSKPSHADWYTHVCATGQMCR